MGDNPLDPITDQRIRELERWRPHVDRQISDMGRKLDSNTRITEDTNSKVGELYDFFTAGKVNAKIIGWLSVVLGGFGGVVAAVMTWFHK